MRYSKLFGKSIRSISREIQTKGHEYLLRAGFLRESSAGRFYFLPLGIRVQDKICRVVEDEMDSAGGQKMLAPVLHPLELWEETHRAESASFELMRVNDRSERSFVLGGTAEEMIVALVRQFALSERDLPFCVYQFSTKFRDELRARGGLLRVREFLMKDAYSFHASASEFESFYERMKQCYLRIFERLELPARVVASDNGYMGGEYCHDLIVDHAAGESRYLVSEDGSYSAHEDIATFRREKMNPDEALRAVELVAAPRGLTIQAGVEHYAQPPWRQIKSIIYYTDKGEALLVALRGDLTVNETKLRHVAGCNELRLATEDEVLELGSVSGFVSPLKLKIRRIGDESLISVRNFSTGADEWQRDTLNVNYGRDFSVDILADIAMASAGQCSVETGSPLQERRGIEVGNIFQLGTWYSERMKGAEFTGSDGQKHPYYMGCYGIGIGRTMATIAELHHGEKGLLWPSSCTPFDIHLLCVGKDPGLQTYAESLYAELLAGDKAVLYDDRDVSAGVKFTDAELIGIGTRLIVSRRMMDAGMVEVHTGHGQRRVETARHSLPLTY